MSTYELRARRATAQPPREREARLTVAVVAITVLALGAMALIAVTGGGGGGGGSGAIVGAAGPETTAAAIDAQAVAAAPTTVAAAPDAATTGTAVAGQSAEGDLVEATAGTCVIKAMKLVMGDTGTDVSCLQQGLLNAGYTNVTVNGTFDGATFSAVEALQGDRDLFVDGVVGRETAISVGVWPDEQSFVVRTPPPAPGATDSMGYALSSVSSVGADAPPLPADSGSGRRVVYDRRSQRVWAVDEGGNIVRSWLVSGSKYGNEAPGVHKVYSRSEQSTAWNGRAILPLMIRYQKTAIGAIGFHGIPVHVNDGTDYQTEAELGTRLSGGCQRQANPDARFLWAFAPVGTTVVVT